MYCCCCCSYIQSSTTNLYIIFCLFILRIIISGIVIRLIIIHVNYVTIIYYYNWLKKGIHFCALLRIYYHYVLRYVCKFYVVSLHYTRYTSYYYFYYTVCCGVLKECNILHFKILHKKKKYSQTNIASPIPK